MKLIIHDLSQEEWNKISSDYPGCVTVSDNGGIHPCIGCFGCWNRTPGQCVVHDGYENMGKLIHDADEVVVISRYTYGGFSGFVKNVFDRCLGYVLPQFEMTGGESHHQKRYDEDKPFTFIFCGSGLSEEEKESARRYVRAVCTNIRGHVRKVEFRETGKSAAAPELKAGEGTERIVLLNGSMRCGNGNSAKLARRLERQLGGRAEIADLRDHMSDMSGLVRDLEDAGTLVLCMPLYVDGLPSQVIRLMEKFRDDYRGSAKKIYVLANMGLYETSQLVSLFTAVRQWCGIMGFEYCGGLGISAGELLGTIMEYIPFSLGPGRKASQGMDRLADAVMHGRTAGVIFAGPHLFPRPLYIYIANTNWNRTAKLNGISPEDLYRRL